MDPQPTTVTPTPVVEPQLPAKKAPIFWISISFLLLCSTIFFSYKYISLTKSIVPSPVNTYEECELASGSILTESYPATCVTIDGKRFIQPLTDEEKKRLEPPEIDKTTIIPRESENWKTYTNNTYKFSFKYPMDWGVTPSPVSEGQFNIIVDKKSNKSEQGFVPIQFSVGMATDADGNALQLDTLAKAKEHYAKQFDSKALTIVNTTIAKKSGISITGVLAGPGPGEGNFIHITLIDIGNQILTVQLGNKTYQSMFDQILSTLAFTTGSTTSQCVHNGVTYQNGQSFKDACNSCSCESGQVACTLMACAD